MSGAPAPDRGRRPDARGCGLGLARHASVRDPWVRCAMTPLTLFGLVCVTAMVVFYAMERRGRWTVLAFASSCVLASAYGFLQGAWPFGLVEGVWSAVALRRWWRWAESDSRENGGTKT